jgi:phosphoenolpyruvate carboxykinase (GTP)
MTQPLSNNPALLAWVSAVAEHTRPDRIHWCAGTSAERNEIAKVMVEAGQLLALDPERYPRSFVHRTHPSDAEPIVACDFVSTHKAIDAGPTNNWLSRDEAHSAVWPLFRGAMRGRTMYVVPYALGPLHSSFVSIGVQLTDSPYIVLCLALMTRVGRVVLDRLGDARRFVRGVHSMADLAPERRFLVHFPDSAEAWSIGSANVANAMLSKSSHCLRIASVQAREDGWLAEHMALLSVTDPEGQTRYVAAVASSPRERAELCSYAPSLPGWKLELLGRDVCWMRPGNDGQLWAINPESGISDRVSSLQAGSAAAPELPSNDVLFTNVALLPRGRVWWEGLATLDLNERVVDWLGMPWSPRAPLSRAAHPRASFMATRKGLSHGSLSFERNQGVPISAILFCGGHARSLPLVYEARTWRHGVFVGATLTSETDNADTPRHDPFGMRDFCGYNLGDYLDHWLAVGRKLNRPPRFFHVNWFRTGADGRRLWPGGAENIRVLKWLLERVDGTASARDSSMGYVPTDESLDMAGLDLPQDRLLQLLTGNQAALLRQAGRAMEFLGRFQAQLPGAVLTEHRALIRRLQESLH